MHVWLIMRTVFIIKVQAAIVLLEQLRVVRPDLVVSNNTSFLQTKHVCTDNLQRALCHKISVCM